MRVEILLDAMPGGMVHLVEGNLRQVIGVLEVIPAIVPQPVVAAA